MMQRFTFLSWLMCLLFAVTISATVVTHFDNTASTKVTGNDTTVTPAHTGSDIIAIPQTPVTQTYVPNSIKDIKEANPVEGISFISTPVANNSGNAMLTFNMRLPEGRAGFQPDLSVMYNNEGGNSWLGVGWNMATPAISIETRWGVPRYDASLETELYTLNGEQLAPVNNRSALIARTAEKRFHQRVEGAFNKIIRHGNSPANYWWEVTQKNGVHNYYGGRPNIGVDNSAVLKDDMGNIAYWALVETRDPNNNFVRYTYETVQDVGIIGGTVPGRQLYLTNVFYTGNGTTDGAYQVAFTRDRHLNEPRRKDITIDARLGFKQVSTDLLRKVTISFNKSPIRSYEFRYVEGAFYKTLLKSISELDDANAIFYSHNFEYYDDVQSKQGYKPAANTVNWSIASDDIKGDIGNPIPGFTGEGSALGTSKANSIGGGVAVTVGTIAGDTWSKAMSVGGGFNYGEDDEEGLVSMIDIDGDGLPDKVFKKNGQLNYRANLGGAANRFSNIRPITGANDFSTSNSKNIGGGVQAVPFTGFLGFNATTTTTTSKIYFSDFNGDGLMDIADGGRVLFNHLNAQGNPVFDPNSQLTPSPVISGNIDKTFLKKDTALQSKQERAFPLHDIVRMWEAPYSGTINITAPVQLIDIPNPTGISKPKKDGVRVSIQQGNALLWFTTIGASDFSVKTPTGVNNLTVTRGQRIYFRLQSIYNGEDDRVSWDPVIEYTTPVTPSSDWHHKTGNYYQASADFILHNKSLTGLGKDGTIVIDGTFNKTITADSITLSITRTRANVLTTIFERTYGGRELANGTLTVPGAITVLTGDALQFVQSSRSYIDRSATQWQPHFAYVSFTDATPVTSGNGTPTIQGFPVPDNSNYNIRSIAAGPETISWQDTVTIWPLITGGAGATGNLWFTIKGNDTIYARRLIQMNGGAMSTAMDSIRLVRKANEPLFFEYAANDPGLAANLLSAGAVAFKDSFAIVAGVLDTIPVQDTLAANLYTNPAQEYLGPVFRGWGQFSLKGGKGDGPLPEDSLNLNELNNYPTDPNVYTDSSQMGNIPDPSQNNFIMLFANGQLNNWAGYDTSVYVTGAYMSSSRLGMHDVSVDSLMGGQSAGATYKVSTTEVESFSAGVSVGPVGASGSMSNAKTTIDLDMMDMNGDRYPDVINDQMIQYTLPTGGLGNQLYAQPIGKSESYGFSEGFSLGGDFLQASTGNTNQKQSVSAQKTAKNSAGLSGSVNFNDDECLSSWLDINGDGLPDRIYNSGRVSLNLGYRFAAAEPWGFQSIDKCHSQSIGAGLGMNLYSGSFEAGIGLSRTTGDNQVLLNDMNGDGLIDHLTMNNGVMMVRLNTGNSFAPAIPWNAFYSLISNVSTGESFNTAFTATIPIYIIFLKICINPNYFNGHGVSRQQDGVMDLDGDGYADMLSSNNDGHLTASASTIGRTNMLRMVKGPVTNSYFTMDYERVGNTYNMPQSKWVLRNVEVFDGAIGDGVDTMRYQFSYEEGYQDRHEREFYGFKKVISRELNTANGNQVYRSFVQQFLNTTFYNKGLLASEWVEDGSGHKYTQTNYYYHPVAVQDSIQFPALKQTENLFYEGNATAGMVSTTQYDYDALGNVVRISDVGNGNQQDMVIADITYHNNDPAYIKSIPAGIELTTAEGVQRKRTTTVNNTGNILKISQFMADGSSAETDMEYDTYGNLTKITRPANYKGQRMWYQYEYDGVVHNYITKVSDALGYTSSSTYDYRIGALTGSVSRNNEQKQYKFDNRGRLIAYTGPHDLAAGKPYTVSVEYNTLANIPYAVAKHFDPEHNGDIYVVSLADGLGRTIQVKKQVSLFKGKGVPDEIKLAIPGSAFDAFGRTAQTFYPITEALGAGMVNLNTASGNPESSISFDVLDRPVKTVLADGSANTTTFTITNGLLTAMTTDALNNRTEIQSDTRNRKRYRKTYGANSTITTRYDYNALNELKKVTDTKGNALRFTYDNLGRKTGIEHPDAGTTTFEHDLAGNLLKKITPQIKKEIPNGGAIQYAWEYERLTDIDYPRQYQNKVRYTYGKAGAGNKAGRIILQEDASGGQEFFYGKQGEVIKVIRTMLINPTFATTYVSEQEYDSWNRVKKITYPDGEVVQYHYNKAGGLLSMQGSKMGHNYPYIYQLGYDEFEQRTFIRYGNGTATSYHYDSLRRRLVQTKGVTISGRVFMNNKYSYDAVSNIIAQVNDVQSQDNIPGGASAQQYQYDNIYRLNTANGEHNGKTVTKYNLTLAYDDLNNIVSKNMQGIKDHEYDQKYDYSGTAPHQPTQIGDNTCKYDLSGNQVLYGELENFYDEENRLAGVLNKGVLSQYTYDARGTRAVKSSGGIQGLWLNGAPAGAVKHNDNYTAYVNPYIECTSSGFLKHYYLENQRIVTKQGHGKFTNISFPTSALTAGNIDYGKRASQIEQNRIDYYASLGVSPGPPTDKLYWARPENTGIAAPVYTDSTATMVPRGWPGNTTPPPNGPPVFVDPVPSNDSAKAGYGFSDAGHLVENSQYFYHPDLWGNTSYISNTLGEISMQVVYTPLGETIAEAHNGSFTTPYLFNAKEHDTKTGYYFYGPRFYEPVSSRWLTVEDPGGDKILEEVMGYHRNPERTAAALSSSASYGGAGGDKVSNGNYGGAAGPASNQKNNTKTASTPKDKQTKQQNGGKKTYRQQRSALQHNAMFFNHATPVARPRR
jgi:RHS repeat-associated protein